MSKFFNKVLKNVSLLELFFPIVADFNSLNKEIDKKFISNNNWDLANDPVEFSKVLEQINASKTIDTKNSGKKNHLVVLK